MRGRVEFWRDLGIFVIVLFLFLYYNSWATAKGDTEDDSDTEKPKERAIGVRSIILMQMRFSVIRTSCQTGRLNRNKITNSV